MPKIRAFVSYSSNDEELVQGTLDHLERAYVSVDFIELATGDEVLRALKNSIAEASLFVLFASGSSLASLWVKAEAREAEFREAMGRITKVTTFLLQQDLDASHLPFWLQRYNVSRRTAPKTIAREIRVAIDDLVRQHQSPVFVGRASRY